MATLLIDCSRCYNDYLPTKSETSTGSRPPFKMGAWDLYEGFADDLAQLFRWYHDHIEGMDHYEAESWLRAMFLCSPFGHSVKTRHAFDHLFDGIMTFRVCDYTLQKKFFGTDVSDLWPLYQRRQGGDTSRDRRSEGARSSADTTCICWRN